MSHRTFLRLPFHSLYRCRPSRGQRVPRCDNSMQAGGWRWGGGTREGCLLWKKKKKKKRELGARPSLSSSPSPNSLLLSCSGPYETSQHREGAQANKQMSLSVCVHRSTEIEEYTHVSVGGENYHGEKTCSDFLHQNLGRRSEEGKLLLEDTLPCPCANTVEYTQSNTHKLKRTQSSTFLHPPPHYCFQTSAESCAPLSHLLSKVTIKEAECV